jgi:hypothetical protein
MNYWRPSTFSRIPSGIYLVFVNACYWFRINVLIYLDMDEVGHHMNKFEEDKLFWLQS